jgi:hypothetical protein
MKFKIGEPYSRNDIHQLYLNKPIPKKGTGNWLTGYVRVGDELVVFINLNTAGKTGHDFDNQYDSSINRLVWFGKPKTHSKQNLISSIIQDEIKLQFFVRYDNNQKYFDYLGTGFVIGYEDGVKINLPDNRLSFAIKFTIQLKSKNKEIPKLPSKEKFNIQKKVSKTLVLDKPIKPSVRIKNTDLDNFEGMNQPIEALKLTPALQKKLLKNNFETVKDLFSLKKPERLTPDQLSEIEENQDLIIKNKGIKQANFYELISLFTHNFKKGLKGRLSGELTLQQAGDLDDITRERIRQLEKKALLEILKIQSIIIYQLNLINPPKTEPLFLWKLEFYNPFFFGISELIKTTSSTYLNLFFSEQSNFAFEVFEGRHILYKKGKASFEECANEISKLGIEDNFSDYLLLLGRLDLEKLLKEKFIKEAPKSKMGKIRHALKKFLPTATTLMSMAEIKKVLEQKYELSVQPNELSSVCKRNFTNFYQFERSKWGIEENFRKLDDRETEILADLAWKYLQDNKNNMIAASVIFENSNIQKHPLFFEKGINSYDLSWALDKCAGKFPELHDHGRQYWSYGGASKGASTKIADIIYLFLEESGQPMHTSKIIDFIKSKRDISNTFQIRSSISMGNIISTKPGYWGIKRRDIPISEEEETSLLMKIQFYFQDSGPIIDAKALHKIMESIPLHSSLSLYQVSRFLMIFVSSNPILSPYFQIKFDRSNQDKFYIVDIKSNIDLNELSFKDI